MKIHQLAEFIMALGEEHWDDEVVICMEPDTTAPVFQPAVVGLTVNTRTGNSMATILPMDAARKAIEERTAQLIGGPINKGVS